MKLAVFLLKPKAISLVIKLFLTFILVWICYVPKVIFDTNNTQMLSGQITKKDGSKSHHYGLLIHTNKNSKVVRTWVPLYGMSSILGAGDIPEFDELISLEKSQSLVEVVFAANKGPSILTQSYVYEIRVSGEPVQNYKSTDLINYVNTHLWYQFDFISFFLFFLIFPKIVLTDFSKLKE